MAEEIVVLLAVHNTLSIVFLKTDCRSFVEAIIFHHGVKNSRVLFTSHNWYTTKIGEHSPQQSMFKTIPIHFNYHNMKQYAIQQEILVVIDSILSKKQWCENIASMKIRRPMPLVEQLKYACTKNFLEEVFPEIIDTTIFERRFYIWPIQRKNNLLQVSICKTPMAFDKRRSINTECFLQQLNYN